MPTDWRGLLSESGIEWVDRGPNSIRGSVVIACPLCGNDPSQHLNLFDNGFHCLRNRRHGGNNFLYLLYQLLPGTGRDEIIALLNRHATTESTARSRPEPKAPGFVEQQWAKFLPASNHPAYLDYLYSRGFPDPAVVCRRYDLRYSPMGAWAARLLIPITDTDGTILSWTGRAIRDLSLRYDTLSTEHEGLIYVPRPMRATALLVEGPMDALKAAEATERSNITPIALLGLGTNTARLLRIADLVRNCREILICLDQGVYYPLGYVGTAYESMTSDAYRGLIFGLARILRSAIIRRFPLPEGRKDLGETPINELAAHLAKPVNRSNVYDNIPTVEEYLHSVR